MTWSFATITDLIVPSFEDGCNRALWHRTVNLDCKLGSSIRRLVQEPAGIEAAAVFEDDETREVEVTSVELDEELTYNAVEEAAVELELEILVVLDIELVTVTTDGDCELEVAKSLTRFDRLLAQISCVEPIAQIPGVNPPKTIETIAFKLAPVNSLKGTVTVSVLPVILEATM